MLLKKEEITKIRKYDLIKIENKFKEHEGNMLQIKMIR